MAEGAQYIECDSSGLVLHADSSALECLNALLVVDRQMSYMRQQVSARMMTRYQNNYHFGGNL